MIEIRIDPGYVVCAPPPGRVNGARRVDRTSAAGLAAARIEVAVSGAPPAGSTAEFDIRTDERRSASACRAPTNNGPIDRRAAQQ